MRQEKIEAQAKKDIERKMLEEGRQFSTKTKEIKEYIDEIVGKGTARKPVPEALKSSQVNSSIPSIKLNDIKEPILKELTEDDEK